MQLLQQLIAAELNASAFGSACRAAGTLRGLGAGLLQHEHAGCKTAQQQSASFNTNGDSGTFTPGTSANSKLARSVATYTWWDYLP